MQICLNELIKNLEIPQKLKTFYFLNVLNAFLN